MKISDFIFRYSTGSFTDTDSICRVRIFFTPRNEVALLLTDLGDLNTGVSVTNSIEWIIKALTVTGLLNTSATVATVIEHDEELFGRARFGLVTIMGDEPHWETITVATAAQLCGCELEELATRTRQNPRLYSEIIRVRNAIDPFIDSPYPESPEVIVRRLDIQAKMIPKRELHQLISAGATERELQTLIKRDLSLIAEVYARPRDDYICFTEFPLADGRVDFAVFSGTSRMDVILIEVKGADFNLLNRGTYGNISAKVNEAAQQIRIRLGHVYRHYSEFRSMVHRIRKEVEAGRTLFNSLVGPSAKLGVDPNKDIYIHAVIIAGRSREDLRESRLRHDFEIQSTPPVRLESWDSWLKKLQRR